jgi:ABC-type transport system involved in cytochrome bd biosynthesis fused ATPase/permease subunit
MSYLRSLQTNSESGQSNAKEEAIVVLVVFAVAAAFGVLLLLRKACMDYCERRRRNHRIAAVHLQWDQGTVIGEVKKPTAKKTILACDNYQLVSVAAMTPGQ